MEKVYSIEYVPSAKKSLNALPKNAHKNIAKAIHKLKANPRPPGCEKLKTRDAFRIREGDYRVIYEIHDAVLIVLVIKIAHRREVYR